MDVVAARPADDGAIAPPLDVSRRTAIVQARHEPFAAGSAVGRSPAHAARLLVLTVGSLLLTVGCGDDPEPAVTNEIPGIEREAYPESLLTAQEGHDEAARSLEEQFRQAPAEPERAPPPQSANTRASEIARAVAQAASPGGSVRLDDLGYATHSDGCHHDGEGVYCLAEDGGLVTAEGPEGRWRATARVPDDPGGLITTHADF